MKRPVITFSRRLRQSPYHVRVMEAGVTAFTVYNHMLLPTAYRSSEEDYWHLREHVQIWDVAAERPGPESPAPRH